MFEQVADAAIEYTTGARSLRGICDELITPILNTVPDGPGMRKVGIAPLYTEPRYIRKR